MYDELINRAREFASLPEHCENVAECDQCPKEDICNIFANKQVFEVLSQAANAIEELQRLVEANKTSRWIPVTERLPETGVDVLVMFPHNMAVASRDMGEWVVNSGDGWCTDVNLSDDEKEPTHWMPLPEPPKEDPHAES